MQSQVSSPPVMLRRANISATAGLRNGTIRPFYMAHLCRIAAIQQSKSGLRCCHTSARFDCRKFPTSYRFCAAPPPSSFAAFRSMRSTSATVSQSKRT